MTISATRPVPDAVSEMYREAGRWADLTIAEAFELTLDRCPGDVALVDGDELLTYNDLDAAATRLAVSLARHDVQRGDVVSFQLPNWWEAAVAVLATAKLGAVANPLQMIYRHSEVRFIVEQCRSKALFVPATFKGTNYTTLAAEVAEAVTHTPVVISVRGTRDGAAGVDAVAWDDFIETVDTASEGHPVLASSSSADEVVLLMYTSGTTSDPKGVLHTHNTLLRAADDLVSLFELSDADRCFMPSPVTHITGLLLGFLCQWRVGASTVLMDRWDPHDALKTLIERRCTFTGGATPFLRGYIDEARTGGLRPEDIPLERGPCGGADVPPSVIYDAWDVLGARFTRIYGATEGVTVTGSPLDDPLERAAETDGAPLPGHDVRIVDEHGNDLSAGETGEVLVRGPSNFVGYFDPSLNGSAFLDDWVRLGDLALLDETGYVVVQGRKKDIIIRSGENISAKEVEDLLIEHPAVQDVAIVGVPDDDVGERACAYVVPADTGSNFDFAEMVRFLDQARIAKQKYPEYLVLTDGLPRTASGKIQKFRLRDDARSRSLVRGRAV